MVRTGKTLAASSALEIGAAIENESITLAAKMRNGTSNGSLLPMISDGAASPFFVTAARRKVSFRKG